ncbi:hypothetical protein [Kitasatospora cheerisanensis]|uniref:Uncharacterized protein n=1 Tax=Kitasatospora cheerisanensis KCTC 2395 TaxID=1348663 RepID=A0A066YH71_9ACTN|nr:hypothetical protein [Kitasatospora cheerisanensis]KDN80497.1 hypothetical protein KCH_77310 [Kitasatospora cheerisanensis KCTC 2395]
MHDPWPDGKPVNARWLDLADRGLLDYDHDRYRIHGVPNNVVELIWGGLITDHPDGPRLTDAGRARLATERARDGHDTGAHHPDAMPPNAAAWVRENVWPTGWLRSFEHIPGTFTDCACHRPPSSACQAGRHAECRHDRRPIHETVVQTAALHPARHPEPHTHPSREYSGTNNLAWVWIAGPPCRQICRCACHHEQPLIQQASGPTRPGRWWVNCCRRIITRRALTDDAWCSTAADAQALADWHTAGEKGPAPTDSPGLPDLAPARAEREQLAFF